MESLRALPSVHGVLAALGLSDPSPLTTAVIRRVIDEARASARAGGVVPTHDALVALAAEAVARSRRPPLRPVVNATGVILQTNLGRAPLSEAAIAAMREAAAGYTNLEYSLEDGTRGSRHDHLRDLVRQCTGADDGLVVNNNAAALLMVLQVFASGRDVIVSRGEAVEIGGGFRVPDVMRQSGARIVEVGTTNRTYTRDYAAAMGPETAALLRVHASNFRVVGFTASAPLPELAAVAHGGGALLIDDLGSGCLLDTTRFGMAHEPTVQESLASGSDLVLFSGDKLLGGPQAGVIAGRADRIERLRRHPLARALRVDKLTIAALAATLAAYAGGTAERDIPVWRMVSAPAAGVRRRARAWARAADGSVVASTSMVGGGSLPGEGVPSWCAAFSPAGGATAALAALRGWDPPIVARVEDERVLLDPRTVPPALDRVVAGAVAALLPPA